MNEYGLLFKYTHYSVEAAQAVALARYVLVRLDEVIAGGIRGVLYGGLFRDRAYSSVTANNLC